MAFRADPVFSYALRGAGQSRSTGTLIAKATAMSVRKTPPWISGMLVGICLLLTNCHESQPKEANSLEGKEPGEARNFMIGHGVECEFRWVPAGKLGRHEGSAEIPAGFWMAADLTRVADWQTVMAQPPSMAGKADENSVMRVQHDDCNKFIARLQSPDSQWEFELPDALEWEHACRAGSPAANPRLSISKSLAGGKVAGNDWGLRDLFGDVEEWCRHSASPNLMKPAARNPEVGSALKFHGPAKQTKPRFLHLNRIGFRVILRPRQPASAAGQQLSSTRTP